MSGVFALARREMEIWFGSTAGFLVPVLFALFSQGLFFGVYGFFDAGQADLRGFFHTMPWLILFLSPALGMGSYASEKGRGTDEVLAALPLAESVLVAGKFLAGLAQIALCLACTLSLPLSLFAMGDPDPGPIATAYLGTFLLAGAALAVCQLVSGFLRSQVAAFLVSAALLFVWMLIGNAPVVASISGRFADPALAAKVTRLLDYVGWISHFSSFERGLVDSRDLVWFMVLAAMALVLQATLFKLRRLPS